MPSTDYERSNIMKSKKEKNKKKSKRKSNVNLYLRSEALEKLQSEADEFDIALSKYVAVILSHRKEVVDKIRSGEIVIV